MRCNRTVVDIQQRSRCFRRIQWFTTQSKHRLHEDLAEKVVAKPSIRKPAARFDYQQIIANSGTYEKSLLRRKRHDLVPSISRLIEINAGLAEPRAEIKQLYSKRKKLSQSLMNMGNKELKDFKKAEVLSGLQAAKLDIQKLEDEISRREHEMHKIVEELPNIVSDTTPDEKETVVKYLCAPPEIPPEEIIRSDEEFTQVVDYKRAALHHVDIGKQLGLLDLDTASRVSGHAFYYLLNDGVLLETALVQYALSKARERGFMLMMPPSIMKRDYINSCGFRPRDFNGERQIYNIELADSAEDVHEESNPEHAIALTGTAEISIAAWGSKKLFASKNCPVKVVGVSRSYRAEAGSRGRRDKGLYRVHEFTKVELFAWACGETVEGEAVTASSDVLEEIRELQEDIISGLGLHARVLNMPVVDLGNSAYQKYDIEAWMPGRQGWGEVTSASNCTDYQSRRLNTMIKLDSGAKVFAHTLNGTAMAVPRVIVALLENYYDSATKRVWIPHVLRPYMGNRAWIESSSIPRDLGL